MRILHIFDDYGTPGERALAGEGSVPTVVYYLAKHAAQKGHEVTVIERDFGQLPKEEEIDGIKYVGFNAGKLPKAPYELIKSPSGIAKLVRDGFDVACKVNRFVKKNDFDVVHAHFPFATSVLVNVNRGLREKMVYTAHIGEEKKRFNLNGSAPLPLKVFSPDLYLMKRVRKSVVLNEQLKGKLVEKVIEEGKIEAIPNGVDVEYFNLSEDEVERVREKYGLGSHLTVMYSGTVTPRKGVEHLIKAGEILNDDNVLFLIVGNKGLDNEYAERVIDYAREKGVNARFTGFVPYEDLVGLYSACDIFVLPSFDEGFGMVLTEALASGKPLIGSSVGGIPMQVKDGWNGFLVEAGNERQLAEKVGYLVENEEERLSMGERSRRLAEDEFDWSRIADSYLQVYGDIR